MLWGTIRGWSRKLGIPEEVLMERFQGLPTQLCRTRDPDDPECEVVADAYAEPDVREALTDLVEVWPEGLDDAPR